MPALWTGCGQPAHSALDNPRTGCPHSHNPNCESLIKEYDGEKRRRTRLTFTHHLTGHKPSPRRQRVYPDSMRRRSWQAPLACFVALAVGVSVISFAMPAQGRGGSGGAVHVRGYIRKDGTYVAPHNRSAPDSNFENNWSTKGNFNPYTGEEGTRVTPPIPGGGSGTPKPSPALRTRPLSHTDIAEPSPPPVTVSPYKATAEPLAPPVVVPPYEPTARSLVAPVTAPWPPEGAPVSRRKRPARAVPNIANGQVSELGRVRAAEYRENLKTCLRGSPTFCSHDMLTPGEREQVQRAEYRENLKTCLRGSPTFCSHDMLTHAEREQVQSAEYRENLKTFLRGSPTFCNHETLTSAEREQVRRAEYRENLKTCLRGSPTFCSHDMLTPAEREQVQRAEYRENLKTCLRGSPTFCNHDMLTPEDLGKVP
jgi:hypothetical protein